MQELTLDEMGLVSGGDNPVCSGSGSSVTCSCPSGQSPFVLTDIRGGVRVVCVQKPAS